MYIFVKQRKTYEQEPTTCEKESKLMGHAHILQPIANLNTYGLLGPKSGMTIKHMLDALTKSDFPYASWTFAYKGPTNTLVLPAVLHNST